MLIGTIDNSTRQQNPNANKTENRQAIDAIDDASKVESQKLSGALNEPHDEYIPSDGKTSETPGIYRLEKDENGQQKIMFNRPDSSEKKTNGDSPEVAPDHTVNGESPKKKDGLEKSGDKSGGKGCTVNTDKVDAEIKKLKEKKQKIEQQLKSTGDDEAKRKELEKQLSQVELELSAKDNDAYKKQNAIYTYN